MKKTAAPSLRPFTPDDWKTFPGAADLEPAVGEFPSGEVLVVDEERVSVFFPRFREERRGTFPSREAARTYARAALSGPAERAGRELRPVPAADRLLLFGGSGAARRFYGEE